MHAVDLVAGAERRWEIGTPVEGTARGEAPPVVSGRPADLTAYLLGRPVPGRLESTAGGPPPLPGWL
ncbi:hypothetical protein [Planotetraspora mira]|uniref:Uncharacterized protein n=1 Tax=Planotetraspora mira TaxID=58121 RepID=A0A8J3TNH6_9ACTN|nr:hypothetical protein [Planotetraspora mira]GII30278.1 hypothetical protein Pmi06nite_37200 [Planotetraspora mira]